MDIADSAVCQHPKAIPPNGFDHLQAWRMTPEQVRKEYPRWSGPCPTCGVSVIAYHSFIHYIAGDW